MACMLAFMAYKRCVHGPVAINHACGPSIAFCRGAGWLFLRQVLVHQVLSHTAAGSSRVLCARLLPGQYAVSDSVFTRTRSAQGSWCARHGMQSVAMRCGMHQPPWLIRGAVLSGSVHPLQFSQLQRPKQSVSGFASSCGCNAWVLPSIGCYFMPACIPKAPMQ